jgi:aspartate 1-decarboxylase
MLISLFKSKIHRVKVTEAELSYVGSITVDTDLLDAAGILPGEQVHIVNNNNGERFITYTIAGERGSGIVCLNGAAARKAEVGDIIIIITYAMFTPEEAASYEPKIVFPDENNRLIAIN